MYTHIDRDQMDLCVTVFSSLRGGHFDDLAGAALDHHMSAVGIGMVEVSCGKRVLVVCTDFFRNAEHCIGKVVEAPAFADSKVWLCCSSSLMMWKGDWDGLEKKSVVSRGSYVIARP